MGRAIPPRTRVFYTQFVEFANLGDPFHSLDLERFYHFIWAAHVGRAKFTEEDLRQQLIRDDISEDDAEELASIYSHCRDFLNARSSVPLILPQDYRPSA